MNSELKPDSSTSISYMLGTMVLLREVAPAVQKAAGVSEYNIGYGGPAGLRLLQEIDRLGQQMGQGEVDAALLKAANNVGGVLFDYPAGQVQRTVSGAAALVEGDTDNPPALAFGPPKH
jgi:hypothetical protein